MNTTANGDDLLAQINADPFGDNRGYMQSSEDDAKLHVEFFMEPVFQEFESKQTNPLRKIYTDTEFIKILIPGDKQTSIIRQCVENDKRRFPQQYARFKQGLSDQVIGTPLSSFPHVPDAKVKEYEFFNIRTIEQLADCPDGSQCGQAMRGFHEDKRRAQQFVEAAKDMAPVNELRDQIEELKAQIASMTSPKAAEKPAKVEAEAKAK